MKRFLIFIFSIFLTVQSACADLILQGEAEYNVTSAREAVEEEVKYQINPRIFTPYLFDLNRNENLSTLLKGATELKDRELALFSVGTYGVVYKSDPKHAYYYSNNGKLEYVDIRTGGEYPYKSYQYDVSGKLVNMGLRVSKRETYLYNPAGKLIAHWVGQNGYDEYGNLIMQRKFLE